MSRSNFILLVSLFLAGIGAVLVWQPLGFLGSLYVFLAIATSGYLYAYWKLSREKS